MSKPIGIPDMIWDNRAMPQNPGDGADEWRCESCIYYPPSSFGGKPCSYCWEGDPYLDAYIKRKDEDGD